MTDIKSKIDIVKEIEKYISLKKKGNLYWGLCPFHKEKTPSFSVNKEKNFFFCFGCSSGGNIISFLLKIKKEPLPNVLDYLNNTYSLNLKKETSLDFLERKKNLKINLIAAELYHKNLDEFSMNYLKQRQISITSIQKYKIGLAQEKETIPLLLKEDFSIKEIKKAGITVDGALDRLRNRLIFPIFDKNSEVIGFSGRSLDQSDPKYVNSPETTTFQKSIYLYGENHVIYGIPIILVEGFFDVIKLKEYNFNPLAIMGTSLSQEQIEKIWRISNCLYLAFDGDSGGKIATKRSISALLQNLSPGQRIYVCNLPNNLDPHEILINSPPELATQNFQKILDEAVPLSKWIKTELLKEAGSLDVPENILIYNNKLRSWLNLIENFQVRKIFHDNLLFKGYTSNNFRQKNKIVNKKPTKGFSLRQIEENILALFFLKPSLIEEVLEELMLVKFSDINYEKMRVLIMDSLTLGEGRPEEIIRGLMIEFNTNFVEEYRKNIFFSIIQQGSYEVQFLKDSLSLLRR